MHSPAPFLLGFLAGAVAALLTARAIERGKTPVLPPSPQIDTVIVRDTIRVKDGQKTNTTATIAPISAAVRVDTCWLRDTVRQRDTLFVMLEGEQVMWEDSLSRIWVSGYRPHVDSVWHFPQTLVVTKTEGARRPARWGVGIQAGATVSPGSGVEPYVGIGVSWNFLCW